LATIDKLKDYRPKRKTRTAIPGTPHSHRGASQYFGSLPIPRSAATTPSISFSRHAHSGSTPGTPALPGAPEPAHTSVWSRLPIPAPFKAGHPTEAPIALEMTSNLAQRRRQGTQDSAESTNTPATTGSGSGAATPRTPGTPLTPGAIAEQIVQPKHKKRSRLFNKSGVSAQEIARQAMTDPLKTLQNPTLVKNGLGLDFASAGDAKKLARDLFHAFRQVCRQAILFCGLDLLRHRLRTHPAAISSLRTSTLLFPPRRKLRLLSLSSIKTATVTYLVPKSGILSWPHTRRDASWLDRCKTSLKPCRRWIGYFRSQPGL
jgi:hypothetical protein